MKHFSTIQLEFERAAAKSWDQSSLEYQKKYLQTHPGSRKKLTGRPSAQIENDRIHERERAFHVIDGAVHVDLGHGHVAIVDRKDYGVIRPYKWSSKNSGGNIYAQAYVDGKVKLMHRMIGEAMAGRALDKSDIIEHKNDNALDNRRENLIIP